MHAAVHEPVLLEESLDALAPVAGGHYVDCTIGLGGHAEALLKREASVVVTGLDRDGEALAIAARRLALFGERLVLVHADFRDLRRVLAARGVGAVDGVLADLGVSSFQLGEAGRGFSFQLDGPLDMRLDRSTGPTAAELLARVSERDLADVLFRFGEERFSRRIARAFVRARSEAPIVTTGRLAAIVRRAGPRSRHAGLDPATRTFQAIRIWVNRELEGLARFVDDAVGALRVGGRFVVISFHSLEDRAIKHALRALEAPPGRAKMSAGDFRRAALPRAGDARGAAPAGSRPVVRRVTKKPVTPSAEEIARNPRARSAKLRAVERVA